MRPIDADALLERPCSGEPRQIQKYCYPCREVFEEIKNAPTIDASKIIPTDVLMNLLETWLDLNPKKVIIVKKADTTAGTRHKATVEELSPVNKKTIEKLKERMNNHDQT